LQGGREEWVELCERCWVKRDEGQHARIERGARSMLYSYYYYNYNYFDVEQSGVE